MMTAGHVYFFLVGMSIGVCIGFIMAGVLHMARDN